MSPKPPTAGGSSAAATRCHCGVCRHVTFLDDWERSPYCTEWDHPTAIRVGDVCEAFELAE